MVYYRGMMERMWCTEGGMMEGKWYTEGGREREGYIEGVMERVVH